MTVSGISRYALSHQPRVVARRCLTNGLIAMSVLGLDGTTSFREHACRRIAKFERRGDEMPS
jgi:hypothetical protein